MFEPFQIPAHELHQFSHLSTTTMGHVFFGLLNERLTGFQIFRLV